MKKNTKLTNSLFPFIFILCFLFSCSTPVDNDDATTNLEHLYNAWMDSYEEKTDDVDIYRPYDYKIFPVSRYRRTYTFGKDGTCKWFVLSPNDGHYEMSCYWQFREKEKLISITTESGKEIIRLTIVELKVDLLRVKTQNIPD